MTRGEFNKPINSLKQQITNALRSQLEIVLNTLLKRNAEFRSKIDELCTKDTIETYDWIEASEPWNARNCELPEYVKEYFSADSLQDRKNIRCV